VTSDFDAGRTANVLVKHHGENAIPEAVQCAAAMLETGVMDRLSRPRRPTFRPGEVLGAGIHDRAFYRRCSRIEMPGPDFLAGLGGVGFWLSGFLERFRLCSLAGLGFGHGCFAFLRRCAAVRTAKYM